MAVLWRLETQARGTGNECQEVDSDITTWYQGGYLIWGMARGKLAEYPSFRSFLTLLGVFAVPLFAQAAEPATALDGYCAVWLVKMDKHVKGDEKIPPVFDGKTYLFPGAEQKEMFDANPAALAPVLGGDCTFRKIEDPKPQRATPVRTPGGDERSKTVRVVCSSGRSPNRLILRGFVLK